MMRSPRSSISRTYPSGSPGCAAPSIIGSTRAGGDDGERRGRRPGEVVARLAGVDVDQLLQAPLRSERGEARLQVGRDGATRILQLDRLRERQRRVDVLVDEQPPDVLERVPADEILDVDPAVAERAAVLVGLGDLRLEGDHALEPGT